MQKQKKSNLYFVVIDSYSRQTMVIFFHYSNTPTLQIQLTSAYDKKANKCSLSTAVIYIRWRLGRKETPVNRQQHTVYHAGVLT